MKTQLTKIQRELLLSNIKQIGHRVEPLFLELLFSITTDESLVMLSMAASWFDDVPGPDLLIFLRDVVGLDMADIRSVFHEVVVAYGAVQTAKMCEKN
jgi:hypothetical protein